MTGASCIHTSANEAKLRILSREEQPPGSPRCGAKDLGCPPALVLQREGEKVFPVSAARGPSRSLETSRHSVTGRAALILGGQEQGRIFSCCISTRSACASWVGLALEVPPWCVTLLGLEGNERTLERSQSAPLQLSQPLQVQEAAEKLTSKATRNWRDFYQWSNEPGGGEGRRRSPPNTEEPPAPHVPWGGLSGLLQLQPQQPRLQGSPGEEPAKGGALLRAGGEEEGAGAASLLGAASGAGSEGRRPAGQPAPADPARLQQRQQLRVSAGGAKKLCCSRRRRRLFPAGLRRSERASGRGALRCALQQAKRRRGRSAWPAAGAGMSLLRVSALRPQEAEEAAATTTTTGPPRSPPPPPWLPSHVQVTVVQARGLRAKGGPGDAFVALQLGRQKHRTSVATQKGGCPRWAEECALEVPPPPEPHADLDAEALLLHLTVWQRALVGPDRFLGRAAVPLAALLQGGRSHQSQWYKLHSKPGKKEKERGEIQLGIQFTRHSLTASMFDLSIKDKPRSPFGKLKDKMKGRQKYDLESASAIVPSSGGALDEDFDLGGRKAKAKGFFFKNKLRKSSLTQSNTSLGSDSTVSSASSMAGLGMSEGLTQSPSRHSSLSTDRSVRDFLPSPKLTHKRAFSDEVSQINMLPESKSVQSLKPQNEPVSRSSLCINGSHVYCDEPSPKPAFLSSAPAPLPPAQSSTHKPDPGVTVGLGAPDPDLPPWSGSGFPKGPSKDPPRFIPSPPILAAQEEDKLSVKTIALSKHRGRVKMEEGLRGESKPVQVATPMAFSAEGLRGRAHEEAQKREEGRRATAGVFRRGSSKESGKSSAGESEAGPSPGPEGKARREAGEEEGSGRSSSWFGLPDAKGPARKQSSPSGPLATTEFATDTCFSEDRGPSPFVRVGERQPESAPQRRSGPQLPAAPPEWDDSFDAFATSRLRPEARREPSGAPPAAAAAGASPPQAAAAELLLQGDPEPPGSGGTTGGGEEAPSRGSDSPSAVLEERGCRGEEDPSEWMESRSGDAAVPGGSAWEEGPARGHPAGAVESGAGGLQGEPARRELAGQRPTTERWEAVALGRSPESSPSLRPPSFSEDVVFPAEEEEREGLPPSPPNRSRLGRPGGGPLSLLREDGPGPGAEVAAPSGAGPCGRGSGSEQERPGLAPPVHGATQASWNRGQDVEEEREVTLEPQGGAGEHRAEPPPPKPPRRFTPLSLEAEANGALWGWQEGGSGGLAERDTQVGPAAAAERLVRGPPAEEAGAPSAVAVIIGAGGGDTRRATEDLQPPAEDDEAAEAEALTSPGAPSGDSALVAAEGAEQFETCPSELSTGGSGLSSAKENTGWPEEEEEEEEEEEPSPVPRLTEPAGPCGLPEPPWLQAAEGPPAPGEPQPSPSVLFWTALEEPHLQLAQERPGQQAPPGGRGRGEEQADGGGPAGSPAGQAPPAPSPQVLAGGMLRQGQQEGSSASGSELSSSWSDDRVVDYKKADFWQAERGEPDTALTLGNPFAPRPAPPLQSNPFAESPPSQAAVLPVSLMEGLSSRERPAEAAPPGPFSAPPSEQAPGAPFLPGLQPLAFSTPSLQAVLCPEAFPFPSPVVPPASGGGPVGSSPAVAQPSLALWQPSTDAAAPSVLPAERQLAEEVPLQRMASPHPVKPISSSSTPGPVTSSEEEEKPPRQTASLTPARSGSQDKLQPTTSSSRDSSSLTLQLGKAEPKRDPSEPDHSAKYYHLTHDELIQLLLKREAELGQEQEHVRELETYIDRLLVRIMEQSPTLLQIPLGGGPKAAK
ncbi:rab11 family-interacting protein 5 [Elgaria multicarinata webbii]|uniref:rab11 family-interacting protein 5 n=1 Tax=Elgaria multicarinata webbii TaxID=159646 RepID=UPI002FCD3A93